MMGLGSGWRRLMIAATAAAVIFLLLPLWTVRSFPSQDGPAHVYNARLFLLLLRGRLPAAADFYQLHLAAFPNWVTHVALAGLLTLFTPAWAERLLLTSYVLALPLSFRWAVTALRPGAGQLAWLALPFVYNKWLHEGFYNRSLALVPFLLVFGYYVRRRGRLRTGGSVLLGLAALWTYFSTATSSLVLAITVGVLAAAFCLEDGTDSGARRWRARLPGLVALAPAAGLLAAFTLGQHPQATGPGPDLSERLTYLTNLYDVVAYDRVEVWIAGAFAVLLAAALAAALVLRVCEQRPSWRDGLLAVALLLAALYLVVPQVSIPGVRSEPQHLRLSLHVLLALVLWIAATVPLRLGRALAWAALAVSVALISVRLPIYSALDALVDEPLSVASRIPRGAVFLPVSFDYEGGVVRRPIREDWIVGPLWHVGARVATAADLVLLENYEAATLHFPLRYRDGANPYGMLYSPGNDSPGCLRLGHFNRLAPRPVEYILLFRRALAPDDACTRLSLRHVDGRYERVATSPRGLAELYRRRDTPPADGSD